MLFRSVSQSRYDTHSRVLLDRQPENEVRSDMGNRFLGEKARELYRDEAGSRAIEMPTSIPDYDIGDIVAYTVKQITVKDLTGVLLRFIADSGDHLNRVYGDKFDWSHGFPLRYTIEKTHIFGVLQRSGTYRFYDRNAESNAF